MIEKTFGIIGHDALTLRPEEVLNKKPHKSGWVIKGKIHEDYYEWVNEFEAHHPIYGIVKGDFEKKVFADSEEGFQHFWKHHQPMKWDYYDI